MSPPAQQRAEKNGGSRRCIRIAELALAALAFPRAGTSQRDGPYHISKAHSFWEFGLGFGLEVGDTPHQSASVEQEVFFLRVNSSRFTCRELRAHEPRHQHEYRESDQGRGARPGFRHTWLLLYKFTPNTTEGLNSELPSKKMKPP